MMEQDGQLIFSILSLYRLSSQFIPYPEELALISCPFFRVLNPFLPS